ncbi:hypothetical protein HKW98_17990 [Stutzerimonas urumqiensis]|uniref:hypothetical protein n=1 Tax=Stutzerimonas urumqiensis TaxID=638269 RepID=UPI003BA97B3F
MLDWLQRHHQLIAMLISTCTLIVWVFYAHLLLANFKRQRRPNLIINRGAGKGLGSLCLISNMSAEPVFLNQLIVRLETSRGDLFGDVTDIRQSHDDDLPRDTALYQATHQGPLRTGDFTHMGTFQSLLRRVAEQHGIRLAGHQPVGDWQFHTLEIRVIAFYGSDRHPLGVLRRFRLASPENPDCELIPESQLTRQLCTRRERQVVKRWGEDVSA